MDGLDAREEHNLVTLRLPAGRRLCAGNHPFGMRTAHLSGSHAGGNVHNHGSGAGFRIEEVPSSSGQSTPHPPRTEEREALIKEARERHAPAGSRPLSPPHNDERPAQHSPDSGAHPVANAVRARARGRPGGGGAPDRPSPAAAIDPGAARAGVRCRRGRCAGSQRPAWPATDLRRCLGCGRDHPVRSRARPGAEQAHRRRRSRLPPTGDPRNPGHVGDRDGHRLPTVRPVLRGRARARRGARRLRPDGGRAAARLHPPVEDRSTSS